MMDPELEPFLAEWDRQWSTLPAAADLRRRHAHFEQVALAMRLPTPEGVHCDEVRTIEHEGRTVRMRVFRWHEGGAQPCLLYLHGGGWVQGSPETHWDITARIAAANRQTVVSLDYALAPDWHFPKPVHECVAVLRWLADEAQALGLRRGAITVGGDSAGANIAAAACLALRGTPHAPAAQLLIYPPVEFSYTRPSYDENATGPIIVVAQMRRGNPYFARDEDRLDPLAAPLLAASHAGLPAAYVAIAEHDPLRDDGRAYAHALAAAGVPVVLDEGRGLIHGYLRAMHYCQASRDSLAAMCRWLDGVNAKAAA